jgi:hypothetical protein
LRKSLWFMCACATFALAGVACAQEQQIDVLFGGSTLYSFKSTSASQAFIPPPEKGGVYPDAGLQIVLPNHFGIAAEGAFRYDKGLYNGFQEYRPIFYDFNGVYTSHVAKKIPVDVMAGIGGETLIFYNEFASCATGNCRISVSSNHFLFHTGVGLRYYFLRHMFVRGEAHYYIIPNNYEFHSDNVFRVGASIGYTFHRQ